MPYIGLDVGTSGCKASVVDAGGNILDYKHCEYSPVSPKPGYVEVDASAVWQAVERVLSAVARPDITAMAIASFGEAAILLDDNDNVMSNSIYYCDIRGSEEVEDILAAMPKEQAQAIAGTAANPMYTASKLLWIKKHQPELYSGAKHIMLFGDYIGFKLTGKRVIDYSLASRTMLLDIKKGVWSKELADALGLDITRFSTPVRTGTPIGSITKEAADRLGLPENVLLVAGGHDQVICALGGGAVNKGDSVDGMGSSECISLVLEGDDFTTQMSQYNFCCEPYVFDDKYLTLAFNASSGTAIRWFRDCFEKERREEYDRAGKNIYQALDGECPEEPASLLFLPHVAGSGTPYLDSSLGGAAIGLKTSTTKQEIYKAILEGICFEMQWNVELLQKCGLVLNEITAMGGSAKSPVMMQIKADVMGQKIYTLKETETGTLGLALLCAKAMGDIDDLGKAAKKIATHGATYTPDPEKVKFYAGRMEQYRNIYPALKSI